MTVTLPHRTLCYSSKRRWFLFSTMIVDSTQDNFFCLLHVSHSGCLVCFHAGSVAAQNAQSMVRGHYSFVTQKAEPFSPAQGHAEPVHFLIYSSWLILGRCFNTALLLQKKKLKYRGDKWQIQGSSLGLPDVNIYVLSYYCWLPVGTNRSLWKSPRPLGCPNTGICSLQNQRCRQLEPCSRQLSDIVSGEGREGASHCCIPPEFESVLSAKRDNPQAGVSLWNDQAIAPVKEKLLEFRN